MPGAYDESAGLARRGDAARDRFVLLQVTAIVACGYAFGASLQTTWIYSRLVPEWAQVELWRRLLANGIAVAGLVAALAVLRVHRASTPWQIGWRVLLAAAGMSVLRVVCQVLLGVHDVAQRESLRVEVLSGAVIGLIAASIGAWVMLSRRAARARTRAAERELVGVELAVRALEDEEIRVRRAVAEGLHGTLQQRLVVIDARLDAVAAACATDAPTVAADLAWVREQLAEAREIDVRQMSRLLYPERLELGVVPAVRALLGRLPVTIATRLRVSDAVRVLDDPTADGLAVADRLLAVRIVEESVTNALKHGPPTTIQVDLDVDDAALVVVVTNDGTLYDPTRAGDPSSGGSRLAQRLRLAGGSLRTEPGERGGARVSARLPLGVLPPQQGIGRP